MVMSTGVLRTHTFFLKENIYSKPYFRSMQEAPDHFISVSESTCISLMSYGQAKVCRTWKYNLLIICVNVFHEISNDSSNPLTEEWSNEINRCQMKCMKWPNWLYSNRILNEMANKLLNGQTNRHMNGFQNIYLKGCPKPSSGCPDRHHVLCPKERPTAIKRFCL